MESLPRLRPCIPSEICSPLPHEEGYLDHLDDSTNQQGHSTRVQKPQTYNYPIDPNSQLEQEYNEIKTSCVEDFEIYQDQPSFFHRNCNSTPRFIRDTQSGTDSHRTIEPRRWLASGLQRKPHEAQLDVGIIPHPKHTESLFDDKATSPVLSTPVMVGKSLIESDDFGAEPPTSPLNRQSPSSGNTLDQYQHPSETEYQTHSDSTRSPPTPLIKSIAIDQHLRGESTSSEDANDDDNDSLEEPVYKPLWKSVSKLSDASHSHLLEIIDGLQRQLAQTMGQLQQVEQRSRKWMSKYIVCLNQNHHLARALSLEQQRKLEGGMARGQRARRAV
ncbi:hypothetical protein CDD82_1401 [Ophiocordyceps australis]|uniref:Uncharacterized protein n=1 Tax=Ophiocordyceps australis TaxID=1399860 RepID=A0A2C5XNM6_9HYPO|nr:hypothetical protein CDD82_1401 [Ophiocordyceps australis]